MKIAFFGTSDRSIPILNRLNDKFELALCLTKNDTLVGRNQEVRETAVKTWAKERNIDHLCLKSLKEEAKDVIRALNKHQIGLGVVADFSFIIPAEIIAVPKYGLINVHFSQLPKLRGASPVQHAIIQGLTETGITFYLMDKHMDTGDILLSLPHPISPADTSQTLYAKLFDLAAEKLPQVINDYLSGKIIPQPQVEAEATYCYSDAHPKSTFVFKEDAKINWRENTNLIERKIRAFFPWPVAWTILGELADNHKLASQIKLKPSAYPNLRVRIISGELENEKLKIKRLQVEGKKEVDWMSFINGYAIRQ